MTKIRRFISMCLCVIVFCGMLGNTAEAMEIDGLSNSSTGMNELTVINVVSDYFDEKKSYLNGETNNISCAVEAIVSDESKHRSLFLETGYIIQDLHITIDSIYFSDNLALVNVTETVELFNDDVTISESISHDMGIYLFSDGEFRVQKDGYQWLSTGFASCSYIAEEDNEISTQALGGSTSCIINIASNEVGYTEEPGTRYTKYSAYYNKVGYDWCACFVSWCAAQANVPNSVIKQSAGVRTISDFFFTEHRYYYSPYNGGTATAQAGDLIFLYGTLSEPGHIGIVTRSNSTYIYYIDGNNGGQVKSSKITKTSSEFIGFGRPNYQTNTHTYQTTWKTDTLNHWHKCANCHAITGKAAHSFSYNSSSGKYVCSVCAYATSSVPVTPNQNGNVIS